MKHFVLFFILVSIPAFAADEASRKGSFISADDSRYESIAEKFDSLFHILSAKRGFNGNVLVAQKGNIIYEKAFGYSDIRKRTPLNIQSAFEIASVSKQFTAMAIMILFDEGKLNFDDSVQKFFPQFPYEGITIRQLLAHRSGLPDYLVFSAKYWKGKNRLMTNRDLMDLMITYKPRCEFEPNKTFKYSNTGYTVLCSIIEAASGMPYDAFMEENIFKPLDMNNTFVYNQKNKKTIEYITQGYTRRNRPVYEGYLSGVYGDKGIYSTVEDMLKWDQVLYTSILVKQETIEKALTANSYDYRSDTEYGFGWRIETLDNGEKIVYHTGFWGGYNSLFARRLSDHTAIVVLSNRINWSFNDISRLMKMVDSPGSS